MNKQLFLGLTFCMFISPALYAMKEKEPVATGINFSEDHLLVREFKEAETAVQQDGTLRVRYPVLSAPITFPDTQVNNDLSLAHDFYRLMAQTEPFKLSHSADYLQNPPIIAHPEIKNTHFYASIVHGGKTFIIAQLYMSPMEIKPTDLQKTGTAKFSLLTSCIVRLRDKKYPRFGSAHSTYQEMVKFAERQARSAGFAYLQTRLTADRAEDIAILEHSCGYTRDENPRKTSRPFLTTLDNPLIGQRATVTLFKRITPLEGGFVQN